MAAQRHFGSSGNAGRMSLSMIARSGLGFNASNGDLFAALEASSNGPSKEARERLAAVRSAALMSMRTRSCAPALQAGVEGDVGLNAQERAERAILASKVLELVSQQPKGFQNWGNAKTRAWVRMAERYGAAAKCQSTSSGELARMARDIDEIASWHSADCAQFLANAAC